MLMKYLALSCIDEPCGKVPIYVELRNLSDHIPAQFLKAIFDYCCNDYTDESFSVFKEGMRKGIFLIFLDGLDEVSSDKREQVFRSIKRMARSFPETNIVASSRPEIDTRSWGELSTFDVQGLTLTQARHLISKIEFATELKTEFLELMDDRFFETHKSFLSVPLLSSLMLLTYHEYQSVPSRITVFYEQAFETLLRRHDRAKEGFFKRELDCKLSSDRFRLVFSAFCYRTLALQEISFTDSKFRSHIARAADVTEVDVDTDLYASDLVSSVCVVMRDGLNLHFIHRSFQEYFAAAYLLRSKRPNVWAMYDHLFTALNVNDVGRMAYDMDPQAFERDWVLPSVQYLVDELGSVKKEERPIKLLLMTWYSIRVDIEENEFSSYSWQTSQKAHEIISQIIKVYGSVKPEWWLSFRGTTKDGISIEECIHKFHDNDEEIPTFEDLEEFDDHERYREFIIDESKIDWIKGTTLYDQLNRLSDNIFNFHRDLQDRIKKRDEIDILS